MRRRRDAAEIVGAAASELVRDTATARIGQRVCPYRIVELVGRGGMGSVYRAERDDGEFERTVAIAPSRRSSEGSATRRRRSSS